MRSAGGASSSSSSRPPLLLVMVLLLLLCCSCCPLRQSDHAGALGTDSRHANAHSLLLAVAHCCGWCEKEPSATAAAAVVQLQGLHTHHTHSAVSSSTWQHTCRVPTWGPPVMLRWAARGRGGAAVGNTGWRLLCAVQLDVHKEGGLCFPVAEPILAGVAEAHACVLKVAPSAAQMCLAQQQRQQ